jgi:N6-adenosine-specific RNA methylase IME4
LSEDIVPAAEARSLAALDEARRQIALAKVDGDVDALREWRDRAAAVQHYAGKRAGAKQTADDAGEVKVRAERALGQLDREAAPGNRRQPKDTGGRILSPLADVHGNTRSDWRRLGEVPEDQFDALVEQAREDESTGVSTARLVDTIKEAERTERRDEKRARSVDLASAPVAPTLEHYSVLCADPPWRYEANSSPDTRSIENHYPTMTSEELAALEVPAASDAVLFMWATSPKLLEALDLMGAWGFDYRTCMVWVKDKIGMGYYARQRHELLLIGRRGSMRVPDPEDRPDSVVEAPRLEHSAKPQEAYDAIVRMYPDVPRIELFARGARSGWAVWGNEAAT